MFRVPVKPGVSGRHRKGFLWLANFYDPGRKLSEVAWKLFPLAQ
jgi:hypothetical protein